MEAEERRVAKRSRRSMSSYNADEWESKRELITRLYFKEGKTLREVRQILEQEHNFQPTYAAPE
jgi:hypothetical protein